MTGLSHVVKDGQQVSEGNKLRAELLQREVDHLNWAKNVSTFLLDDKVRELSVQVDHTKCKFGEWYYGEGRKQAEAMLPELKDGLTAIEEPHRKLHESAALIKKVYNKEQGDQGRREAEAIFTGQTQPSLQLVQKYLGELNETSKKNILSDDKMIAEARTTQAGVIALSVAADACPPVQAIPEHVRLVWNNLISNAIKYTPPGGEVRVSLSTDGRNVVGRVEDTGIGMSPEEQKHLFREFYRSERAKALQTRGTGLGLAIVKRVLDTYGATIEVQSTLGKGSVFIFRWPI